MAKRAKRSGGRAVATLAIDIGGSGLKASVLDADGKMLADRVRVKTPDHAPPAAVLPLLVNLVKPLPRFHRVSVGFPGVVRGGVVRTAPNLGTRAWAGFDLGGALAKQLGKPVRVVNDADMQGSAVVAGKGVEIVVTLGTGFGTAVFQDGRLGPHTELAHHPFLRGRTYEDELGDKARRRLGKAKWNRRVKRAIDELRQLFTFDHLYVGGGNARLLKLKLPKDVTVVDNSAGITGGIALWRQD